MAAQGSANPLHPPRLAPLFAVTPSAPGTPVHSIQTMRRKSAGHGGPLTKILVANRGVCLSKVELEVHVTDLAFWMSYRRVAMMSFASVGNCHPCVPYRP